MTKYKSLEGLNIETMTKCTMLYQSSSLILHVTEFLKTKAYSDYLHKMTRPYTEIVKPIEKLVRFYIQIK